MLRIFVTVMIYNQLYIDDIEGKGRGVFSATDIPAETIIEIAPVIVMDNQDRLHLDQTLLHDYIFEWLPDDEKKCCMALGYVPIYNHSYNSNCEYLMDYEAKTITITTIRNITANEELTINYNGDWDDKNPVWFDVA